jgi:hypothetical protein
MKVWILWRGPGHRINTCVSMPESYVAGYRARVVGEWGGWVLAVYRLRSAHK